MDIKKQSYIDILDKKYNSCDKILKAETEFDYSAFDKGVILYILYGEITEMNFFFGKLISLKCVRFNFC